MNQEKIITEIEFSILATLISKPEMYEEISEIFCCTHITAGEHVQILAKIIINCIVADKTPDFATIGIELKKEKNASELINLYVDLISSKVDVINLIPNTIYIREQYYQVKIKGSCSEAIKKAVNGVDSGLILSDISNMIYDINSNNVISKDSQYKELAAQRISDYDKIQTEIKSGKTFGIASGLTDLDRTTGGWQNSDLIILAAQPSMGKTAMSLFYTRSACKISNKNVAFFSLEMAENQLVDRVLLSEAEVNNRKIRDGHLNEIDWQKINDAYENTLDYQITIIDDLYYFEDIVNKIRALHRKGKCEMCVIDYLTRMSTFEKYKNKNLEVEYMTKNLKSLAKQLNIPIILLSQLNRNVESRGGGIPRMSDLRDSGAVEQDADLVIFLHRPDYQVTNENEKTNEIITVIAKQRNGELGSFTHKYNDSISNFYQDIEFNEEPTF